MSFLRCYLCQAWLPTFIISVTWEAEAERFQIQVWSGGLSATLLQNKNKNSRKGRGRAAAGSISKAYYRKIIVLAFSLGPSQSAQYPNPWKNSKWALQIPKQAQGRASEVFTSTGARHSSSCLLWNSRSHQDPVCSLLPPVSCSCRQGASEREVLSGRTEPLTSIIQGAMQGEMQHAVTMTATSQRQMCCFMLYCKL